MTIFKSTFTDMWVNQYNQYNEYYTEQHQVDDHELYADFDGGQTQSIHRFPVDTVRWFLGAVKQSSLPITWSNKP